MNSKNSSMVPAMAGLVLTFLVFMGMQQGALAAINIADYFPLGSNNEWHYTGQGQPGSSLEDNFWWRVQAAQQPVGGGVNAWRIKTDADDPGDGRDEDEDFWRIDGTGRLLFYGFHNGQADTGIPAQTVIAQWPLLVGRANMNLGDTITSKTRATVTTSFGDLTGTVTLTAVYDRIDLFVLTKLGMFTHVLHVTLNITITVPVLGNKEIRGSEIWLKKGLGMIKQDQKAKPNEARVQVIDSGKINNVAIKPDYVIKNGTGDWILYE